MTNVTETQKAAIQEAIDRVQGRSLLRRAVQDVNSVTEQEQEELANQLLLTEEDLFNFKLFIRGEDFALTGYHPEDIYVVKHCRFSGESYPSDRYSHFAEDKAFVATQRGVSKERPDNDGDLKARDSNGALLYVHKDCIFAENPLHLLLNTIKELNMISAKPFNNVATQPIISCPGTGVYKAVFEYLSDKGDGVAPSYTATEIAQWEETNEHFCYVRNFTESQEDFSCQVRRAYSVEKSALAGVVLYCVDGSITAHTLHDSFKPVVSVGLKKRATKKTNGEKKQPNQNKHGMEDSRYYSWKESQDKVSEKAKQNKES